MWSRSTGAVRAQQQAAADQQAAAQQTIADQQAALAGQEQAPAAPAVDPQLAQLENLANLPSQGILSDEEFAAAKAKALGNLTRQCADGRL